MNGLDLFSGIGGLTVALQEWVKPVAYCEIDKYCQGVLLSRMATNDIANAPIWDDITSFPLESFTGEIDIIYGGFPCQDISVAGNGAGLEGKRSGLFFEIMRLSKEIKPKFIFLENVPAITTRGGLRVVREIAEMGYDCRWCIISAASVGARHRRERWFLLAHTKHDGQSANENGASFIELFISRKRKEKQEENSRTFERTGSISRDVADTKSERQQKNECMQFGYESTQPLFTGNGKNDSNSDSESIKQANSTSKSFNSKRKAWRNNTRQCWPFESREHWQEIVDGMGRVSDGVPYQVDRIKSLGNAVVPPQAKKAFEILMGL